MSKVGWPFLFVAEMRRKKLNDGNNCTMLLENLANLVNTQPYTHTVYLKNAV